jgi:hypothetical protein
MDSYGPGYGPLEDSMNIWVAERAENLIDYQCLKDSVVCS